MAHTVKTCLHGNELDTCNRCPHPLSDIEVITHDMKRMIIKAANENLSKYLTDGKFDNG